MSSEEQPVVVVAGIDEAGRGALAGPVCAAAVILGKVRIRGLNDSKKLTPEKRDALYDKITVRAPCWAVAFADVGEIDRLNILQASLLAMARAVSQLAQAPHEALVDGNQPPRLPCKVTTVIGGDALHPSIMAASILAKVTRDRAMVALDAQFPGYGFAQHKGYGTPEHLLALGLLGPSAVHRRTFAPVMQMQLQLPGLGARDPGPGTGIQQDPAQLDEGFHESRVPSPESRQ